MTVSRRAGPKVGPSDPERQDLAARSLWATAVDRALAPAKCQRVRGRPRSISASDTGAKNPSSGRVPLLPEGFENGSDGVLAGNRGDATALFFGDTGHNRVEVLGYGG